MVWHKVSLDQSTRPKGELIEVPPLGVIPNGGSIVADIPQGLADQYNTSRWVKAEKATAPPVEVVVEETVAEGGED